MQQRKLGVNRINPYFFMEISSYYRQKSGDVTKVPYLLEVPDGGFTILSREIVKFNAIKLNFSMTEIVDQKLNFALRKEEELGLWLFIVFIVLRRFSR